MSKTILALVLLALLLPAHICQAKATKGPAHRELIFAYFPMAVPVAPLGEVLRRDQILTKRLAKQGLTIRFVALNKGKEAVELLRQQKLDAVSFSDLPLIESMAVADIQVLGIVKQSFSAVVAPRGTLVRELRKKRIGTVPGSTSHYALLQALQAADIKEQDVTLVAMEAVELPDALAKGRVDAVAAWEPTPTVIMTNHPDRFSLIHRQSSYGYFALSSRLLEQQPAAARELAAALVRAVRWLKKSPANLGKASQWTLEGMSSLTGKKPRLTATEVATITSSDLLAIPGAPLLPAGEGAVGSPLHRTFSFMQQQGQVPASLSWQTISSRMRPAMLRDVSANPSRYLLNQFSYAP